MSLNEAGQYVVPVAEFSATEDQAPPMQAEDADDEPATGPAECAVVEVDYWECREDGRQIVRRHVVPRVEAFTPCSEGCPVEVQQLENQRDTRAVGLSVLSDSWKDALLFFL